MEGSILFQSLCNEIVASTLNPLDNRIAHPQQCDQKYCDTPVDAHIAPDGQALSLAWMVISTLLPPKSRGDSVVVRAGYSAVSKKSL